jgi:hypothetical protein
MYTKKDIEKSLLKFNYFIDENTLSAFIKTWKIDAIYEDEDGIEFFDNVAIAKLKKGISLKSQGFSNEQIVYHINKLLPEKMGMKPEEKAEMATVNPLTGGEIKNVTIDVTSQTLQMLADSVAEKITSGIKEQIRTSDFAKQVLEDSSLQEENESLSQKVEELLEDNKKLAKRVEELEQEKKKALINFSYFRNIFK